MCIVRCRRGLRFVRSPTRALSLSLSFCVCSSPLLLPSLPSLPSFPSFFPFSSLLFSSLLSPILQTHRYYRKLGYEVEGAGGYMTKLIGWRARCINRIGMRRCATWSSQLSPQRRRQIGALAIAGLAVLLVLAHVLFVGSSSPPLLVTWLRRSE